MFEDPANVWIAKILAGRNLPYTNPADQDAQNIVNRDALDDINVDRSRSFMTCAAILPECLCADDPVQAYWDREYDL